MELNKIAKIVEAQEKDVWDFKCLFSVCVVSNDWQDWSTGGQWWFQNLYPKEFLEQNTADG